MKNPPRITVPAKLPDDPAALKAMVAAMMQRCDHLELRSLRLEMELLRYKKWMYGPRADRLASPGDVAQMLLCFGEEIDARPVEPADAVEVVTQEPGAGASNPEPSRRVKRGRRNLGDDAFASLPVTRHEHDVPEQDKPCPCCGTMRERIGAESSWQIEYIPGRFERLEHVRLKYACRRCEQKAASTGPQIQRADKAVGSGLAGPGLLAFVATSKFSDYLPLYRLEDLFERSGFAIARSTMSLWCRDMAQMVLPLYDLMVRRVLQSGVIGTDDTVMPMLSPGAGRASKARMWVYVGDQDHPYNVFEFTLSRSRDGPTKFLKSYRGTLLADAYGGYDGVVVGNEIVRAGCWAHARRKFVDAQVTHPAIAAEAVALIARLYAIESRGKAMDAASRGRLRRSESAPILATLKARLFTWRDELLPKHPMARAVGYALNQWNELSVFAGAGGAGAEAGNVPIDNNASEREMKRIVLNRKNSLFAGSERGGRAAAILSSLASTCRRHDLDPQRYFTQLLTNLPATPTSQLERWLPDVWKRRDPPPPPA